MHDTVLFVGDRPNPKKNLSMNVPFVGTKSYKNLLEWFYLMDVDIERVFLHDAMTVSGKENEFYIQSYYVRKVVALGEVASHFLNKKGSEHFKLPSPGGVNDERQLTALLSSCKKYIYKE